MNADQTHPENKISTVRVLIKGRVQGVWYRGWMVETACSLDLNGWVLNRRDGSVEAVISGPEDTVNEMLQLCERGPSAAHVRSVERIPLNDPVPKGFKTKPSA